MSSRVKSSVCSVLVVVEKGDRTVACKTGGSNQRRGSEEREKEKGKR